MKNNVSCVCHATASFQGESVGDAVRITTTLMTPLLRRWQRVWRRALIPAVPCVLFGVCSWLLCLTLTVSTTRRLLFYLYNSARRWGWRGEENMIRHLKTRNNTCAKEPPKGAQSMNKELGEHSFKLKAKDLCGSTYPTLFKYRVLILTHRWHYILWKLKNKYSIYQSKYKLL